MCDPSVFLWLQHIRYHTENYESVTTTVRGGESRNATMTAEVEKINTKPVIVAVPFEVKHANECRLSCEFLEESVEELGPVTVVERIVDVKDCGSGCEPDDVMLWKNELRYECSSEDECEEFTQQVGRGFSGGVTKNNSLKFPYMLTYYFTYLQSTVKASIILSYSYQLLISCFIN